MQDFLIVGGGVAGLSAASRLAVLGSTTVLEREDALGYHTSGRSAALFEENYGSPSTIALNRASRDYMENDDPRVLSARGLLLIGAAEEAEAFSEDCKKMALDRISRQEALGMVPIIAQHIDRFAYHNHARDIDTDLLMQNYARKARAAGGIIRTMEEVVAIRKLAHGWEVDTSAGSYAGRILINAAGAWADVIATMARVAPIGLQPLRRSVARVEPPEGYDVSNWPILFGPNETWYAKPDAGKLIISPADEELVEPHDAWADDMVLAEGIARYEACVTEPVTRMIGNWAGLRTFAPDRNLVIGFDAHNPNFFWLAGQGGYGMQSSPGASKLVANLISGSQSDLADNILCQLSPARFA